MEVKALTGLHELERGGIVLFERLIEPWLREVLERIGGILAGAGTTVLHSPGVLLRACTLLRLLVATRYLVTARPSSTRVPSSFPSPLLSPLVAAAAAAVLPSWAVVFLVDSDHGHLTTRPTIPGQH